LAFALNATFAAVTVLSAISSLLVYRLFEKGAFN
jgi:hypothetical protein